MSTYYYFKCNKCNKVGGFFSRQAWGWGNFDIIASFKFLAKHCRDCGHEYLRVICEHNDFAFENHEESEEKQFKKFLQETRDIFPSSDDWEFMRKPTQTPEEFRKRKEEWVERRLHEELE